MVKNKKNQNRCTDCRYVKIDGTASEYTLKRCKNCEYNARCTCKRKECKCGKGCEYRNTDEICPKQIVKWTAFECGCPDSDYYKSLLNVSKGGEKLDSITWTGCEYWRC